MKLFFKLIPGPWHLDRHLTVMKSLVRNAGKIYRILQKDVDFVISQFVMILVNLAIITTLNVKFCNRFEIRFMISL